MIFACIEYFIWNSLVIFESVLHPKLHQRVACRHCGWWWDIGALTLQNYGSAIVPSYSTVSCCGLSEVVMCTVGYIWIYDLDIWHLCDTLCWWKIVNRNDLCFISYCQFAQTISLFCWLQQGHAPQTYFWFSALGFSFNLYRSGGRLQ